LRVPPRPASLRGVIPIRDNNPTRRTAFVTLFLIAVNVVVYVLLQPKGTDVEAQAFIFRWGAVPCEVITGEEVEVSRTENQPRCELPEGTPVLDVLAESDAPEKNVYLALLTSIFLHGSLLHLGGNMLSLWIFGNNIEDEFGHVMYTLFYLVAGVFASLVHVVLFQAEGTPVVGASGAIAGVMGAYAVLHPKARVDTLVIFFFITWIQIPAAVFLGIWLALQFLIANGDSNVAWAAHVGGFVFGLAAGYLARQTLPHYRRRARLL
jgi:membrane associated rhomboid family serine protease